jgi:hypothetical protein
MWERGCFSTTTLAPPRRPCRPRHLYAVPRTSPQCVCTWRRNCIEQLSPSSPKYAPGIAHFPARNSAIIKLTRYPAVSIHSRFVRTLGNPCAPAQTAAGRDRACDLRLSRCTPPRVIFSCRGIGARASRFSGCFITVPSACAGCAPRPIDGQGRQPRFGLPPGSLGDAQPPQPSQ